MAKRILSYLIFWTLMTVIITGSAVFVVTVYLPFVAAKAVCMTVAGRARPKLSSAATPPGSTGRPSGAPD